jgi:hypothetical protein
MERISNEREKQIDRVLANTAGMYGEVRGIAGASVPPVPALELDAVAPTRARLWRREAHSHLFLERGDSRPRL